MTIIPEQILYALIRDILKFVKDDFNNAPSNNKTDTILYDLFHGVVIDDYNYYEQAQELILANEGNPRLINVRLFFDLNCANLPTIHITLPAESPGIGYIGQKGSNSDDDNFGDKEDSLGENYAERFATNFESNYNIIVTSSNTFEVLIIYSLLKYLMLSFSICFSLNGLQNMKISGQDIMNRPDYIPATIFMRGVNVNMFYEFVAKESFTKKIINHLFLEDSEINGVVKHLNQQIV
jgi:hypothetical protein